ncbi:hypothetical protein AMS68_002827 [Peltaster fructicola]|uniref:C2H2-type domain-containing protein n=1 Tax=Peltaster fructicola TaxID=286661 RepID=A0A6H0XS65_9PEZI|nr:hypothetical protein AMS68_002827 [Peltaster fructicola]
MHSAPLDDGCQKVESQTCGLTSKSPEGSGKPALQSFRWLTKLAGDPEKIGVRARENSLTMSSLFATTTFVPHVSITQQYNHTDYNFTPYMSTSQSPLTQLDIELLRSIEEHQASRQSTRIGSYMHTAFASDDTQVRLQQQYRVNDYAQHLPLGDASSHGSLAKPAYTQQPSWSMHASDDTYNSMGFAAVTPVSGFKRQRSHQRTPSASTVASTGPASPYNNNNSNASHPQIANTDFDPSYNQAFSKDPITVADPAYLSVNYVPGQASGIFGGSDMKSFALDNPLQFADLSPSSRQSMSTVEQDSPTTPGSASEDVDVKQVKNVPEFRTFNPHLQLARTESAAYQDELYNPANYNAAPAPKVAKLQPPAFTHRTLVNQRLETANMARSQSPTSAQRERSPFREGSQLAPADSWTSPSGPMSTAASRRQKLKEEREEAEYALHRPQLQREPTKTISPKDALLDYNEADQPSLFQDSVPIGYKQHLGNDATEALTPTYLAQRNPTTFTLPPSSQTSSMAGFRASPADAFPTNFNNFTQPALPTTTAAVQNPYLNNYQQVSHLTPTYPATSLDPTPDFPAHLTSMESSISEGPPLSSQESATMTLQRPTDTRAATGAYTCTYHGCAQRFESPTLLQKHKREFHRSQQPQRDGLSVDTSSESPRSTASPAPTSGSGLTSAQILARNSQAGPHKCTRINPSTGKPCNTIFSRPYDLTRHEDTIHNGRKQKVRCPYCREEKTFSRNDALTRHMRVVHPDVENSGKRGRRGD